MKRNILTVNQFVFLSAVKKGNISRTQVQASLKDSFFEIPFQSYTGIIKGLLSKGLVLEEEVLNVKTYNCTEEGDQAMVHFRVAMRDFL